MDIILKIDIPHDYYSLTPNISTPVPQTIAMRYCVHPNAHVPVYTVCFVVVLCLGCLCRRALMNKVTLVLWLLCCTMLHNAVANEQPQCDLLWS